MEIFSRLYSKKEYVFALDMTMLDFGATYVISVPTVVDVVNKITREHITSGSSIDMIVMLSAVAAAAVGYCVNYKVIRLSESLFEKAKSVFRP